MADEESREQRNLSWLIAGRRKGDKWQERFPPQKQDEKPRSEHRGQDSLIHWLVFRVGSRGAFRNEGSSIDLQTMSQNGDHAQTLPDTAAVFTLATASS